MGVCGWKQWLGDPEKHWKRGHSALELAASWEAATKAKRGIPTEVVKLLDQQSQTKNALLLLAIPEHKVAIPGGGFPSQTDLWALLNNGNNLISLAIEGKAGEPFGEKIDKWQKGNPKDNNLENSVANRNTRLEGLCKILQLPTVGIGHLYYQLLHRTASAILEAERFGAKQAVMIIQSFEKKDHYADFEQFATALGATGTAKEKLLAIRPRTDGLTLWIGWTDCNCLSDEEFAKLPIC